MALGAMLEPLIVVSLLVFGTIVNRNKVSGANFGLPRSSTRPEPWQHLKYAADHETNDDVETGCAREDELTLLPPTLSRFSSSSSDTLMDDVSAKTAPRWRKRRLRCLGWEKEVTTPNTEIFKDRFLSRVLQRFPFLVEVWYWALIYWVYQLGRAFTAVTLQESTVNTAREHGLQVIHAEQALGLFVEPAVQQWFLKRPTLMRWTNKTYSFIHIPGTILYLIILYHITIARPRHKLLQEERYRDGSDGHWPATLKNWRERAPAFGPPIYERRRRTMAMCNLLAFIVFTFWPCMPPRLLSDPTYMGENSEEAKGYGFIDTVHGADGDSSVWTTNRFCNQYAAMPSLHFGYSFLIGLTIAAVPLLRNKRKSLLSLGGRRTVIIAIGMVYPAIILTAIVATANHYVLDAVAGAVACTVAWMCNDVLLNLVPLEDYFLATLRIHKP
ncbi:PAP2 superfamily-domain-containing protein [Dichotomopilus funicola]|uniref:PAP2 superfamily-domain-containing protein n=1 Tax=Dichotomopilus funicola TaxID=1934379 RepID=A0AAN6UVZ2_9PEZI|nr:PAP2 superfamily-domain-containing protein [Dichotomopilus funicola]